MTILFSLLLIAVSVGNLVCLIIVLTKLFPAEGALKGILGIICGIYTFIWGWMNADQQNIRKIMQIWTLCFIASIVLQVLTVVMAGASSELP